ncbi:copper fist DNA binding domain-containing protein [Aspergillus heterothallicus]
MPLDEEGNKWSCDPCLRGHRSSKCQHFDRLMAKVPRSGRPSKKCPHAKRNCGCRKSYALITPLSYGSKSLCRLVYYVSRNSEEPSYTPESYHTSPTDNWHNLIESDFCPQPPHIPDVFDIISQTPMSPTEESPLSYFPPLPEDLMSSNSRPGGHSTGLGMGILSEDDLAAPTVHHDINPSLQDAQQGMNTCVVYELGYDMHQLGFMQTHTPHMTPTLHDWSTAHERAP